MTQKLYDTIVIGAGQAGLAMGYYLQKMGRTFLLLDGNQEIGDVWRKRYDSLTLFTPRSHSALPGLALSGSQAGYPTKNEIADYLKTYAKKFNLPVQHATVVEQVMKQDGNFRIKARTGQVYKATNVIVATGPFHTPFYPDFYATIPNDIYHIHASEYLNPTQLKKGLTVVVGGGNSGMQIAEELSIDREVYMSVSKQPRFLPSEIMGRSIFWWLEVLGISKWTVQSLWGKLLQKNDPIIGRQVKELFKKEKIKLVGRTMNMNGNRLIFADGTSLAPENIVWATGYRPDYRWLLFPNIFNEKGEPIHTRGITEVEGLFYLGLSWQHNRGSALLLGVGEDANYIANTMC